MKSFEFILRGTRSHLHSSSRVYLHVGLNERPAIASVVYTVYIKADVSLQEASIRRQHDQRLRAEQCVDG